MVLTDDVAHDASRFLVGLVVGVAQLVHGVQNAPMHGLKPVAGIRERASDNHAHRVVQIGRAHLIDEVYRSRFQCGRHGGNSARFAR